MKNKYLIMIFFGILAFITSCNEEDTSYMDNRKAVTYFTTTSSELTIGAEGESSVVILVGSSDVSNSDRTFTVEIDPSSTAVEDVQFTADFDNLVIPAGQNFGEIKITGIFENSTPTGHELVLNLVSVEDSEVKYDLQHTLKMYQFCDFDISLFVGNGVGDDSYGYPSQVVTTLDADDNMWITGLGVGFMENDWGEVITNMETLPVNINAETGEFTIDLAYYMSTTYGGEVQPDYYLKAVGKFNSCTGEAFIDYDFVQGGTSYTAWLTNGNGWPAFYERITFTN